MSAILPVLGGPTQQTPEEGGEGPGAREFLLKYVQIMHFYAFFNHFYGALLSLCISLMSEPLRIWILSIRSSLLFLLSAIAPKIKVRSRAKSDFKERCAQLWDLV